MKEFVCHLIGITYTDFVNVTFHPCRIYTNNVIQYFLKM